MFAFVLIPVLSFIMANCYQSTFVICGGPDLMECLEQQVRGKVVSVDSSSTEKGVYKVKYKPE